jgi:hypothetical protein
MVQVDQMLDAWKSTGSVYSVALDAEERLVRVSPNLSELGIEPPDVLGLTYSQFRDRLGFGPDHATRTWNADPNQVIDEIDERTEPLPQGTLARRLRRRRTFPSVPGGAFATVEKIAIQQEIYPGFEPALVLVRYPGSPRGDGAPWHEFHPEMAEVDTMLTGWKTMGGVVSLGVDANGRVLFVEDPSSMLGLAPDQLVGLSVDEVRSQMGFAHPQAKRTWQADPGCALDEIDEVAQSIPAGTFCRRLRRRRVPTYRGDLPIEAVEKLAVQEELYKAT